MLFRSHHGNQQREPEVGIEDTTAFALPLGRNDGRQSVSHEEMQYRSHSKQDQGMAIDAVLEASPPRQPEVFVHGRDPGSISCTSPLRLCPLRRAPKQQTSLPEGIHALLHRHTPRDRRFESMVANKTPSWMTRNRSSTEKFARPSFFWGGS